MLTRALALAICLGAAVVAGTWSPSAEAHGYVSVTVAPPPPVVERVVVRPGYVWTPGYWRWTGHRHVWVGGYAVPARVGYRYVPARWVRTGPAWSFHAGYWAR